MATIASTATVPITYNPPPHPSVQFVTPNLGFDSVPVEAPVFVDAAHPPVFTQYPLGKIYMGEAAFTYAMQEKNTKYGFRFMYNPTTIQGQQNVGTNFIPDPSNTTTAVLQEGLENIAFRLLINRQPEVEGGARGGDYAVRVSEADMMELRTRGTHYDLEFLYRTCNGLHNTTYRKGTGDIGILLPNPCYLDIGPFHTRGALMTIAVEDWMFNDRMVPMLTWVDIVFSRYVTMKPTSNSERFRSVPEGVYEQMKRINLGIDWAALFSQSAASAPQPGGGGGGGETPAEEAPPTSGGGSSTALSGAQVERLCLDAGFSAAAAKTATKIAWAESGYRPKAHNGNANTGDNSYGLFQINMIGDMGPSRRKQFGISKNDELFNPTVNVKAAYKVSNGGKNFRPWTTYTSGKYRKSPAW